MTFAATAAVDGCWQVQNRSTLQRLRGKTTNIPPTTRNYSLYFIIHSSCR